MHQVLQVENKLYVKAEKSKFHAGMVSFLGFIIAPGKIQVDPAKVSTVVQWPTPDSPKKVPQFLGFENFYRQFIRNFSAIAAPLYALSSPHTPFQCTPLAKEALQQLKTRFTTTPILTVPDPSRQFLVEMDTSNEGVGAVLSQCSENDNKLHPCAFLSRKLSLAERNYIRKRKLLAVKVWTDHKNLEYIRKAKRVNSRQARWTVI